MKLESTEVQECVKVTKESFKAESRLAAYVGKETEKRDEK